MHKDAINLRYFFANYALPQLSKKENYALTCKLCGKDAVDLL